MKHMQHADCYTPRVVSLSLCLSISLSFSHFLLTIKSRLENETGWADQKWCGEDSTLNSRLSYHSRLSLCVCVCVCMQRGRSLGHDFLRASCKVVLGFCAARPSPYPKHCILAYFRTSTIRQTETRAKAHLPNN